MNLARFIEVCRNHPFVLAASLYGVLLLIYNEGIGQRDADNYIEQTLIFMDDPRIIMGNHWGLRWPIILSIAASFWLFGVGELQVVLPFIGFGFLLIWLAISTARNVFGGQAALLAGLLLASSPLFGHVLAECRAFAPEVVFLAGSFYFLVAGYQRDRLRSFVFAGFCGAGAWLTRETGGFMLPVLFVAGLLVPGTIAERSVRAMAASGAMLAVIALELLTYFLATGDPLYRAGFSLNHGGGKAGTQMVFEAQNAAPLDFLVTPITQLLTNGAVMGGGVALAIGLIWLVVRRRWPFETGVQYYLAGLMVMAMGAAFVINAYVLSLEEPFYFIIVPYGLVFLGAAALAGAFRTMGGRWQAAVVAAILAFNIGMIDTRQDRGAEDSRELARIASSLPYPVVSDYRTVRRARTFVRLGIGDGLCPAASTDRTREIVYLTHFISGRERLEVEESWQLIGWSDVARQGPVSHWLKSLATQGQAGDRIPKQAPRHYVRDDTGPELTDLDAGEVEGAEYALCPADPETQS